MSKEVELLPEGLVSCLINNYEVRIVKISPEKIIIRVVDKIDKFQDIKVNFYVFDKANYEEINIVEYEIMKIDKEEFYYVYEIIIKNEGFSKNVMKVFNKYSKYINLKVYGDGNDYSKDMVGYPSEKDYDYYEFYDDEKRQWFKNLESINNKDIYNLFDLAISLDNDILYNKFIHGEFKDFTKYYFEKNYVEDIFLNKKVSRIYIGNEFCHNLFPKEKILFQMMDKSLREGIKITIAFTYLRECYIDKTKLLISNIYKWCKENNESIELIINDWGILKIIENMMDYIKPILGVLLNKRKKDPRYKYKNGYEVNKDRIGINSLNSSIFQKFLKKSSIERYEYESCGYKSIIPKGKHSLHLPFYVTNTSQYCTLYAMCTSLDRGKQVLVRSCPKYCKDYVFLYPKHLKMVGRYNSLFSFDSTVFSDSNILEYYYKSGIDRIVLNFI